MRCGVMIRDRLIVTVRNNFACSRIENDRTNGHFSARCGVSPTWVNRSI